MRAEVAEILANEAKSKCSCGWGKSRNDKFQELSSKYNPLKMLEVPISEVIKWIIIASHECMERQYHSSSNWGRDYYHEPLEYIEALAKKVEMEKRRVSICLDCARGRGEVESCRFKHE